MITIENKVTNETCIKKIRVMTNLVYSENDYHCLNCSGINEYCDDYKKVGYTERIKHLNLYNEK